MKILKGSFIILLFIMLFPLGCIGQHVFSEMEFEYGKTFLPYDVPYTFALEDKQFVMLTEVKKNTMKLVRYDQYFFEQWQTEIELNSDESAPQAFVRGDTLILYSFSTILDEKQIRLSFKYFDLKNGIETHGTNYVFSVLDHEGYSPKLLFSQDKLKFLIYNYLVSYEGKSSVEFQIFDIGNETPLFKYHLDSEILSPSKALQAHLSNEGDLFLTTVLASEFKVETYFFGSKSDDISQVNNNFFFERPVDNIGEINIVRQSSSSYFVSFTANIEDELIGFNITGFNVVLKTVMYSYNQNLRRDEIESLYANYYVTSPDQKKKNLEVAETFENFHLVKSFVNSQNDIILFFENLEIPVEFHENAVSENMPWKHKFKEDKFYFGGDILMYCYSEGGQEKWKKVIQKTQFSQGSGLGLSFIDYLHEDNLDLLMYESSKGGNFYVLSINTLNGSLTKTINLIPNDKFEFTKKYSCWLNEKAVVICGIAPANINNRSQMLVEF